MASAPGLQRDLFIDVLYNAAQDDRDIMFISADLGAQALDRFRVDRASQFIHAGISEQQMMDMAAGLAMAGKKVFTYAMACFATARCYEQTKCAVALHRQPVTLIGVGVGMGYDDAGPTHYTTEDMSAMRALAGLELWTPGDAEATVALAHLALKKPALRYIRLERPALPDLYHGRFQDVIDDGCAELRQGTRLCLISCGYMLHRCLEVATRLAEQGHSVGVIDLFRLKPLNAEVLVKILSRYERVMTVEEHFLYGGFGSAVLEGLHDVGHLMPVTRVGMPDHYFFENGTRAHLLKLCGLDVNSLTEKARALLNA